MRRLIALSTVAFLACQGEPVVLGEIVDDHPTAASMSVDGGWCESLSEAGHGHIGWSWSASELALRREYVYDAANNELEASLEVSADRRLYVEFARLDASLDLSPDMLVWISGSGAEAIPEFELLDEGGPGTRLHFIAELPPGEYGLHAEPTFAGEEQVRVAAQLFPLE